jgi:hypothetical protein
VTAAELGPHWHRAGGPSRCTVHVSFVGFDGLAHTGAIVVHRARPRRRRDGLPPPYTARFPIRRMEPVTKYSGNDALDGYDQHLGFNCRYASAPGRAGYTRLREAIDVNTIENPTSRTLRGPAAGAPLDRSRYRAGMAVAGGVLSCASRQSAGSGAAAGPPLPIPALRAPRLTALSPPDGRSTRECGKDQRHTTARPIVIPPGPGGGPRAARPQPRLERAEPFDAPMNTPSTVHPPPQLPASRARRRRAMFIENMSTSADRKRDADSQNQREAEHDHARPERPDDERVASACPPSGLRGRSPAMGAPTAVARTTPRPNHQVCRMSRGAVGAAPRAPSTANSRA